MLGHKGALPGSRDEFLNFETPLISLERMKIQTSNFACGLTLRDTEPKSRDLLTLRFPTGGGVKLPPGLVKMPNLTPAISPIKLKFEAQPGSTMC